MAAISRLSFFLLPPNSARVYMRRLKIPFCRLFYVGLLFVVANSFPVAAQTPQATRVTVFEGARLIVGDGSPPIEGAAFIVENNRFTRVGRRGELPVPAGAARVAEATRERRGGERRAARRGPLLPASPD